VLIPEKDMARKIARSLMQPSVIDFLPLSGDYVVAEVAAPARFTGKKLMDVGLQSEFHVQVIAIKQGATDAITYAPGGQYQVGSGDVLVVLGREEDIATLARHD
ncbi:MAG TPA: TrkA C-terminal domain-containing protein, partial [candidate division Zixibacteria bacterium]|nr:TrkA C-terminal domain-containing protein [candidate division Zixibacteria bacterium]